MLIGGKCAEKILYPESAEDSIKPQKQLFLTTNIRKELIPSINLEEPLSWQKEKWL